MSPVEWTAIGVLAVVLVGSLGYLARRIDRLEARMDARFDRVDDRLDRLDERYIQHLEHHARFA